MCSSLVCPSVWSHCPFILIFLSFQSTIKQTFTFPNSCPKLLSPSIISSSICPSVWNAHSLILMPVQELCTPNAFHPCLLPTIKPLLPYFTTCPIASPNAQFLSLSLFMESLSLCLTCPKFFSCSPTCYFGTKPSGDTVPFLEIQCKLRS